MPNTHLNLALYIVFKLRDEVPFKVLGFCAMPHASVGHDQHIVSQKLTHVDGLWMLGFVDPVRQSTDHRSIFFLG